MKRSSNYDKFPTVKLKSPEGSAWQGWDRIRDRLNNDLGKSGLVVVECYPGVDLDELCLAIDSLLRPASLIDVTVAMKSEEEIDRLVAPFNGGDDPVFGYMSPLRIEDFYDVDKLADLNQAVLQSKGRVVVIGPGASLVHKGDVLVYADLARWEAQMRMRRDEACNLGTSNFDMKWSLQYKRAYFTDWRVCDRLKRKLWQDIDYLLDTNMPDDPKMVRGAVLRRGLEQLARQPFRVVPFFDPAPWGGQWMKDVCGLDHAQANFGWCFDCVPEENSLLLEFDGVVVEIPSVNLVFQEADALLGPELHQRFGAEFPIRFDFLDTIGGGNLSLQVHPKHDYICDRFGMAYTQDESYYMLDADKGATVFLGLSDETDPESLEAALRVAQEDGAPFDAGHHVNQWPAKKHDHFLIPCGTIHCSGSGAMVLEISATPYIFTFKLWDWGRLGLDGKPRPINIDRGMKNISWERRQEWTLENLINRIEVIEDKPGFREERTGLHELEFIETRRHWFTGAVPHSTGNTVNVLNLVEGGEVVVESPDGSFEPFTVHYAETFIVPAAVGDYTIRPANNSTGNSCATMKAFVRPLNQREQIK